MLFVSQLTVSKQLCHCINHTALNWDDNDKWPVIFFIHFVFWCSFCFMLLHLVIVCAYTHCLKHIYSQTHTVCISVHLLQYLLHDFLNVSNTAFSLFMFFFIRISLSIPLYSSLVRFIFCVCSFFVQHPFFLLKIQLNFWPTKMRQQTQSPLSLKFECNIAFQCSLTGRLITQIKFDSLLKQAIMSSVGSLFSTLFIQFWWLFSLLQKKLSVYFWIKRINN